jgi:hypothetical protein
MQRRVAVLIISTLLVVALSVNYKPQVVKNKPDAYEVIKYMNDELSNYPNDINDFYLLFDNRKLDTKNFVQVFSFFNNYDYHIIEIYPYINPMYQSLLKNVYKIKYEGTDLRDGVLNIYNTYLAELDKNNLSEEMDKVLINGFKIRMVKINLNNTVVGEFINKYKGVKYSLSPYGLFVEF